MISYTDLFGGQRAKLVPAAAIADMQKDGAGFAGFATWLDMTPAHPDMFGMPDAVRRHSAAVEEGSGLGRRRLRHGRQATSRRRRASCSKNVSRRGGRPRAFASRPASSASSSSSAPTAPRSRIDCDTASKPCYDQQALMRRYDVIAEICDYMLELGWGPYQNDHEDANGQFEMNWNFDDALITADRHSFFKFMAKSVAEKHGLRATFMPKPFTGLTGNGCHAHISVWDNATGKTNMFFDNDRRNGPVASRATTSSAAS